MHKDRIEQICNAAGMRAERRVPHGNHEIFIADGFSLMPHTSFQRFGVDPTEFPHGMYATLWWVSKDEKLDTGQPIFFDVFHNPELDAGARKQARVNTALREAEGFLKRRGS